MSGAGLLMTTLSIRIAIGDVKRQVKLALTEKGGEKEVPLSDELRKFAAPLTGIVGGAATGVGVFQMSGPAGLGTTLGAVAAALLSMLVLTAALAPKRTRNDTETLDFSPDTSVGSLVWRLGRSIDLLFRAGLAPVFVIDELDKTLGLAITSSSTTCPRSFTPSCAT